MCVRVYVCGAYIYICILYDAFGGMCMCGGGAVFDIWCETVCNLFSSYFLLIIYATYPHDGYAALKVKKTLLTTTRERGERQRRKVTLTRNL